MKGFWGRIRERLGTGGRSNAGGVPPPPAPLTVQEQIDDAEKEVKRLARTIRLYRAQHIVEGGTSRANK